MPEHSLVSQPPRGLLLWLLRLPIVFYRLGLGWLLGQRFLMLNHVGRKSGKAYQTVVEVVGHDGERDAYYVVSGWGYGAQWYRNLQTQPQIAIRVGRRRLDVTATTLEPADGAAILEAYRQRHPVAARELSRLMGLDIFDSTSEQLAATIQESLPVVVLRPR